MAKVAIAILAAGESKRMGCSKQLISFQGLTLLQRALIAAKGAQPEQTIVVLGARYDQLAATISGENEVIVYNGNWIEGIASSIRTAVENLAPDIDAVLFLACDQPLVDAELLRTIIETYETTNSPVVASDYGTPGIPALFAREIFPQLLGLRADRGAKAIILANTSCLVPAPQARYDIDTNDDIERLEQLLSKTTAAESFTKG